MSALGQQPPRRSLTGAAVRPPILLQYLDVFADGVRPGDFAVALFRSPDEGGAAATHRHRLLTQQLRRTGSRRDWRRTAEELDETPQVLRGCSEQHLVLYSAQAAHVLIDVSGHLAAATRRAGRTAQDAISRHSVRRKIAPHVPVWDKSARSDGTFS